MKVSWIIKLPESPEKPPFDTQSSYLQIKLSRKTSLKKKKSLSNDGSGQSFFFMIKTADNACMRSEKHLV